MTIRRFFIGAGLAATAFLCAMPTAGAVEIATMPKAAAEKLLAEVIGAGVAAANCSSVDISEADNDRLIRSTDLLAARLGISTDELDARWYDAAFDEYDADSDAYCVKWGPRVAAVLKELPL